jgi:hypothetical protein
VEYVGDDKTVVSGSLLFFAGFCPMLGDNNKLEGVSGWTWVG